MDDHTPHAVFRRQLAPGLQLLVESAALRALRAGGGVAINCGVTN